MAIKITCSAGKDDLNESEKEALERISNEYLKKIERNVKNIISFDIHLKCARKKDNIKRYLLNVKIISPGKIFDANVEDYNLNNAANKAFEKILTEIEHKCHSSDFHGIHPGSNCK